ncbi:MAG: ADP-forming succinate--CoA ligase subunit beta [bacterium]|nr:ADP-forming succinate--CoA ligase subunit beta [bacterium]
MNLYEYQGKKLFEKYQIPTTKGILIDKNLENDYISLNELNINFPVVLKSQVKVGGRGKAGGIKVANNKDEFMKYIKQLFNLTIKGVKVNKILIDEYVPIEKEFYLSFIIDRSKNQVVFIFSPLGGIDIEEVAEKQPDKISKLFFDYELFDFQIRDAILKVYNEKIDVVKQIENIALKLFNLFKENDCILAEINPLVLTKDGRVFALDSKIIIDDNSEVVDQYEEEDEDISVIEREAKVRNLAYVELDGDIGIIGNGAGLVMTTMDLVGLYNGKPANFLDVGGGAKAEKVKESIHLVLKNPKIKALFINIFGGITRCDEVAKGIIQAFQEQSYSIPVVIRLEGTNKQEGKAILEQLKELNKEVFFVENAEEGAQKVVSLIK